MAMTSRPYSRARSAVIRAPPLSVASTTTTATSAGVPTDDQALLKAVSAQPGDLKPGEQVTLYEDGDKVKDQVTLDYCGFDFQTEQYRVARRQVAVGEPESSSGASVEAVRYQSGRAADALDEYIQAVEQCPPSKFQPSTVDGVPAYRYESQPIPEAQIGGLLPNHLAVVATATPKDGDPEPNTIVLQQRGDFLVATYGDDEARTIALAVAVGQHLAALPAEEIGA